MTEEIVKENKKKYKTLGEMVKAGDYDVLCEKLQETKDSGKLEDFLKIPQGRLICEMDVLLLYATQYKNDRSKEIIQKLIEFGSDVGCRDANGITPFMTAAHGNNVDSMKLFVEVGYDAFDEDNGVHSALYHAVKGDAPEAIEYLVKEIGIDIDKVDAHGRVVFHYAASDGLEKSVDKLIELGANPMIETKYDEDGAIPAELVPEGDDWEEMAAKLAQYYYDFKANDAKPKQKNSIG